MSDSLQHHGLYSPWNSPGQNMGVGSLSLLQGSSQPRDWTHQVSLIAGRFFYQLSHKGSPRLLGVGSSSLLQIFPTQESNQGLLNCRWILCQLNYEGNWTIKKAEGRRIDAFEMSCWKRLLRVPWTARSSNKSILKEINPEYSLEVLMLKLELQYFGHRIWRAKSLEKTLMLGKTGQEEKGWHRMTWWWLRRQRICLQCGRPGLGRFPGGGMAIPSSLLAWRNPMDRGAWWGAVHGVEKNQTSLSD